MWDFGLLWNPEIRVGEIPMWACICTVLISKN